MTTTTTASSVLLWLRDDLPREQSRDHWRGGGRLFLASIEQRALLALELGDL